MVNLVGLVLFGILAIIQSTIISTTPLLLGTVDLILLFIIGWALQDRVDSSWQWCLIGGIFASLYSALPFGVFIVAYLLSVGIARVIKHRIWKAPLLAMLAAIFISTIVSQVITLLSRIMLGVSMSLADVFNLILLPSLLLNLILAIPVFSIMRDLARWLYPEELEV
jgi:rod shape-determining protein MreD